jgi:hypothetical protein
MSALFQTYTQISGYFECYGNDDSIQPPDYKYSFQFSTPSEPDFLWPRSRFMGADYVNYPQLWNSAPLFYEWNILPTGQRNRKHISGQTVNSGGGIVPNATVWLFNTATGLLVDTQTSDSGGNYIATDPNNVTCFAVGYLSGSPDTAGVTVDTLTGT